MIKRVLIVSKVLALVCYASGNRKSFPVKDLPQTVLNFILDENVKGTEDGIIVMYSK